MLCNFEMKEIILTALIDEWILFMVKMLIAYV